MRFFNFSTDLKSTSNSALLDTHFLFLWYCQFSNIRNTPDVGFLALLCRFNLRSFDLSVGLGLAPTTVFSLILLYVSHQKDHGLLLVRRKLLSLIGFH